MVGGRREGDEMYCCLSFSFSQSVPPPSLLVCPHYERARCIERIMTLNCLFFAKFKMTECAVSRQMRYENVSKIAVFCNFVTFGHARTRQSKQ